MRLGRMIQGDLGEQARVVKLGGNAMNVNQFTQAENAPLIDLATKTRFESVKVFDNPKKYVVHLCDLQSRDDWASSRQLGLLDKSARMVMKIAPDLASKGCLPKGLSIRSGLTQVKSFIRNSTAVVVPDDHVRPARRYLLTHIKDNAPVYGVQAGDRKGIVERFKELKDRVQGCGRTYADIVKDATLQTQRALKAVQPAKTVTPQGGYARPQPKATPPSSSSAVSVAKGVASVMVTTKPTPTLPGAMQSTPPGAR